MRLFLITLMVALLSGFSSANAASQWLYGLGYKARLIEGVSQADGNVQAAFEIVLEEGWSTYWRVPGEYGIPPIIDFKDSKNVEATTIHWPAPEVFVSGSGLSIGYKKHVVLPVTIVPKSKSEKVELNLTAFFGVCSDICVPADAKASLIVDPQSEDSYYQPIIDDALIRVPRTADENGLDVKQASLTSTKEHEHVHVRLQLPDNVDNVSVITEGPQDWFFEPFVAEVSDEDIKGKTYMAKIPLYRIERTDISGNEQLRVTVVTDGTAIEKTISLRNL